MKKVYSHDTLMLIWTISKQKAQGPIYDIL